MAGSLGAQANVAPVCIWEQAGVFQVAPTFVVDDGELGIHMAGERGVMTLLCGVACRRCRVACRCCRVVTV
jgi:hypothetical protein